RVGRRLVPRLGLGAVRPDPGKRRPVRRLLVFLESLRCRRGRGRPRRQERAEAVREPPARARPPGRPPPPAPPLSRRALPRPAARFAQPPAARQAARELRRSMRAVRRGVRSELTGVERARGLVSLRSLGLA